MLVWLVVFAGWVADRTGAALARERPYYRPLSLLLAANVAAEITRHELTHHIDFPGPYTGVPRLTFHVEQTAGLVWPYGVAAVALVVLARRSPWPVLYVAGLALAARVGAYPWLRQERLAWLLLVEQVALVGLGIWAWLLLKKHARPVRDVGGELREGPAPWLLEHHKAVAAILVLEGVNLLGPHLISITNGDGITIKPGNPYERWALAQIGYTALFVGLALWQWRRRWAALRDGD